MRIEDLTETLNRLRDWIDNADTKTSVLIAILAVFIGFTVQEIRESKEILLRSGLTAGNLVLLGIWIVYLVSVSLSLYHSLHSLTPHERVQLSVIDGRPVVTDFPGIGCLTFAEYATAIQQTDEEHLRRELIQLCYNYGLMAYHKFQHYKVAMLAFRIALLAQVALFIWITVVLPGGV